MLVENIEFSIEDVLDMHRGWITALYVEEQKSEGDIVGMLHERRLSVTLTQIERRVKAWNLVSAPKSMVEVNPQSPSEGTRPSIRAASLAPTHVSYTTRVPSNMYLYSNRPLPPAPTSPSNVKKPTTGLLSPRRRLPKLDSLKLHCHHGPLHSDVCEFQTAQDPSSDGPTQMQLYVEDEQTHERIAMGLGRVKWHRRAVNAKEGTLRQGKMFTIRGVEGYE